jgi:hypothetical protein
MRTNVNNYRQQKTGVFTVFFFSFVNDIRNSVHIGVLAFHKYDCQTLVPSQPLNFVKGGHVEF